MVPFSGDLGLSDLGQYRLLQDQSHQLHQYTDQLQFLLMGSQFMMAQQFTASHTESRMTMLA